MAGVFELVDVGPDFGLPGFVMSGGLAAGGAAGVQADGSYFRDERSRQFDENAADFLNLLVGIEHVLVAQQVIEAQLAGFGFGLGAGVKWAILRPQLFGGVAGHPESLFVVHSRPAQGLRNRLETACEPARLGQAYQCNLQADRRKTQVTGFSMPCSNFRSGQRAQSAKVLQQFSGRRRRRARTCMGFGRYTAIWLR